MAPELGKYLLQVQIGYQNVVAAEQQSPATENWTHFFMSSTDTTVTISNASGTAVKNPNGSYTLTIVITQATFSTEKGQEGEFIGATTETKNITNSNPWSAFQHPVTTTTGPQSITYGQAVRSIGADGMAMAVAAATPGQLSHFPHQVAQDILHHPLGTLGMVIRSTGIAVMEVCPWCGTLMAIGGEALGVADSAKDNTPYP
jgi:hypothetical protein